MFVHFLFIFIFLVSATGEFWGFAERKKKVKWKDIAGYSPGSDVSDVGEHCCSCVGWVEGARVTGRGWLGGCDSDPSCFSRIYGLQPNEKQL